MNAEDGHDRPRSDYSTSGDSADEKASPRRAASRSSILSAWRTLALDAICMIGQWGYLERFYLLLLVLASLALLSMPIALVAEAVGVNIPDLVGDLILGGAAFLGILAFSLVLAELVAAVAVNIAKGRQGTSGRRRLRFVLLVAAMVTAAMAFLIPIALSGYGGAY